MAYKKRSYRKTYRKRKLSNYNIATKTSAKAQSKQIYALKKRINYIQRLTKPEIVIQQREATPRNITAAIDERMTFPQLIGETTTSNPEIYPVALNTVSSTASTTGEKPNQFARAHSITFYGNWQYSTIGATNTPLTMRVVIAQTKLTRGARLDTDDIFTSGNTASSRFAAVYGPLQNGLSRTCKVLSDKRYQLNYQRPNVSIQTRLRYLSNFYRDNNNDDGGETSEIYPKGSIYVFYAIYTPASTVSASTFNLMYKLAYTDA